MTRGPPPTKQPFRVVIALGYGGEFPAMIESIVRETLPGVPIEVTVSLAQSVAKLAAEEAAINADLIVVFVSNLHEPVPGEKDGLTIEERIVGRVQSLRGDTSAILFCGSGHWSPGLEELMRGAGADLTVPLPFEMEQLRRATGEAHARWDSLKHGRFRVLLVWAKERFIADMYAICVREILAGVPIEFAFPDSYNIHDIAVLPEARRADLLFVFLSNLVGKIPDDEKDRRTLSWHARRIRILRNTCPGFLIVMSSQLADREFDAMKRIGVDSVVSFPARSAEITPAIQQAYARWLKATAEDDRAPTKSHVTCHSSLAAQPPSLPPRSRTVLLGKDQFGEILVAVLQEKLAGICEFTFTYFASEDELRALAGTGKADLIFLYVGNVWWNFAPQATGELPDPKRPRDLVRHGIEVLGEISRTHNVPVIATQGQDLSDAATRAGISFLEAPFTLASLMPTLYSALGFRPPPDPPPAA